jgi:osmotically inducible protein OsmC
MKRNATALWKGKGKEGKGMLSTQSGVLSQTPYTFQSRFGEEKATNPEELIAAAHAGCFAMKLSLVLDGAGFVSESLEATSVVTIENGTVTSSAITLNAKVPGIDPDQFHDLVKVAKNECPISKLLNAEITIETNLEH